jgi:hypothetical protein
MDVVLRLILRLILVPLGYFAAVLAGAAVILFGAWRLGEMAVSLDPGETGTAAFGFVIAGPILFIALLTVMWLPAAIGILISEGFAIRSWIFHALNGVASAWIGFQVFGPFDNSYIPLNYPLHIAAAGLAGGFAYWLVAGSSAGFWKPVFGRASP